ncbi:MAG: LysR family transcriptional regulator [Paucibacter sp.]|nr:LysR family transcriptional regulator [Roseateles sp.]
MARDFDDLMLGSLELFCLAAEHESFTQAAQLAGLNPTAVSRTIARLEARLGVKLFVRSTRSVQLTDSGKTYFELCRKALDLLRDAEHRTASEQSAPSGVVRLSMTSPYAHYRVLPLLPKFRQKFPKVEFELHLSNRNVDFTSEHFDLAIRGRKPPDSTLIARKLEDAELALVAAPAYLARAGIPRSIDDLAQHDCLQFLLPSTGQPIPWLFRIDGQDVQVETPATYRCTDDYLGPVTLARAGAGLLQAYRYIVQDDIAHGRLVELLPEAGGRSRPFSIVYPNREHTPLRVRAFIEFLVEEIGAKRSA